MCLKFCVDVEFGLGLLKFTKKKKGSVWPNFVAKRSVRAQAKSHFPSMYSDSRLNGFRINQAKPRNGHN